MKTVHERRKKARGGRKKRRLLRMTPIAPAAARARRRFYLWEECYREALRHLISSLSTGSMMKPEAIVRYAITIADQAVEASEKRRPVDEE